MSLLCLERLLTGLQVEVEQVGLGEVSAPLGIPKILTALAKETNSQSFFSISGLSSQLVY